MAEKRFKGRKPFPIICTRIHLVDGVGRPICGEEVPPQRRWPMATYERRGRRLAEAILLGDLPTAFDLCSKALRKRVGRAGLARWAGDWKGAASPLREGPAAVRNLREHLAVEATDDADDVWDLVAGASDGEAVPPESVLAIITMSIIGRREEKLLRMVADAGEPRIGRLT